MKKTQSVNINDVYHTIKSPIVSIKSMLFVLGRNKDVQSNQTIKDKIIQLENKLNLLHKRAEIFLNYILYKEEQIEFLYSFFNTSETLKEVIEIITKSKPSPPFSLSYITEKPIMGDKDQLIEAFRIIFTNIQSVTISKEIPIKITFAGRNAEIILNCKVTPSGDTKNEHINSDEECVAQEQNFIAEKIIEMHGGNIEKSKKNDNMILTITLPLKARPRSKSQK